MFGTKFLVLLGWVAHVIIGKVFSFYQFTAYTTDIVNFAFDECWAFITAVKASVNL